MLHGIPSQILSVLSFKNSNKTSTYVINLIIAHICDVIILWCDYFINSEDNSYILISIPIISEIFIGDFLS